MKIYVRKIYPHDVTHEVSVTTDIVAEFFDGESSMTFVGKNSGQRGTVTINAATDPRFGGAYKNILEAEGGVEVDDLTITYKNRNDYSIEIVRPRDNRYPVFFAMFEGRDRHLIANADDELPEETVAPPQVVTAGENILLYGVPGAGKSYEIKTNYCDDDTKMERVVFHPDYTYSDFIGQILPTTDGTVITYPFTPGPFTRILKKAVDTPDENFYLVIEEINRGNAPAIFGEVFQLLDRIDDPNDGVVGESSYGINNSDIATAVFNDPTVSIKIPSNLYILATMNTADQNVFTLDTAFKRRWKMKSIKNDIDSCTHARNRICGTNVTWAGFANKINELIIEYGEGNLSSEDNRLGAYFVKASDLTDPSNFAEKVLMYLWNDAFKFDKDKVFKAEYKTLEQLIEGFIINKFAVFDDDIDFGYIEPTPEVNADEIDNKLAFTDWMHRQVKPNGDHYSELTINQYVQSLSRIPNDFAEIGAINVFTINDVVSFNELASYIRGSALYDNVNRRNGNGSLEAGLIHYEQYLSETTQG